MSSGEARTRWHDARVDRQGWPESSTIRIKSHGSGGLIDKYPAGVECRSAVVNRRKDFDEVSRTKRTWLATGRATHDAGRYVGRGRRNREANSSGATGRETMVPAITRSHDICPWTVSKVVVTRKGEHCQSLIIQRIRVARKGCSRAV